MSVTQLPSLQSFQTLASVQTPPVDSPTQLLNEMKLLLLEKADEHKQLQREWFIERAANILTDKKQAVELLKNEIIELATTIGILLPPSAPFRGWGSKGAKGVNRCVLDGRWKLRFTTAPDATFKPNKRLGNASTTQLVDANNGVFVNEIDFDGSGTSKISGLRVYVEGKPNENEPLRVDLKFKKIVVLRNSRLKILRRLSIVIPSLRILSLFSKLFRTDEQINSKRPSKTIVFVDEDMRIHKTNTGLYFVQSKHSNRV